jgi:hypothetical protein
LVIFGVFFQTSGIWGNSHNPNPLHLSECGKADLETHFQFFDSPKGHLTFVVDGLNISSHACIFNDSIFDPQLETYDQDESWRKAREHISYPVCKDCEYDQRGGQDFYSDPTVKPGDVVRKTFRWKSTRPVNGKQCFHPGWMSAPAFLLSAPSLMETVCSDIAVVGVDVVDASNSARQRKTGQEAELELTSSKDTYFSGEYFSLHLSRIKVNSSKASNTKACPVFFVWERDMDGSTRMDEDENTALRQCSSKHFRYETENRQSGVKVDSGAVSRWGGMGEHELQVFQQIGPLNGSEIHLARSRILRIKIADPTTIQRKWTSVKGVAANITLDKDTYQVGEDVPLHLAIANLEAEDPIYSSDPIWDPCRIVGIKVLDESGKTLAKNELFEVFALCMGDHGFGPKLFEKGKVVPLERHLKSQGWLPNHPGTYTIVVSWGTCTGTVGHNDRGWNSDLKTYAIAQASAIIHIVGNGATVRK